jgi:hypothetical protein
VSDRILVAQSHASSAAAFFLELGARLGPERATDTERPQPPTVAQHLECRALAAECHLEIRQRRCQTLQDRGETGRAESGVGDRGVGDRGVGGIRRIAFDTKRVQRG